jgi:hypothetical protein
MSITCPNCKTNISTADPAFKYQEECRALRAQLAEKDKQLAEQQKGWTCFHCGETFTDEKCAREHFGTQQLSEPACKIQGGAIHGILEALRDAEEQLARYYQEDSDVCRSMHAMATKHAAQLRRCEELGYERGLIAAVDGERLQSQLSTTPKGLNHD